MTPTIAHSTHPCSCGQQAVKLHAGTWACAECIRKEREWKRSKSHPKDPGSRPMNQATERRRMIDTIARLDLKARKPKPH
jgi:hypothetical protein